MGGADDVRNRMVLGAPGGDRTHDPWLRRPVLYPLSYGRDVPQAAPNKSAGPGSEGAKNTRFCSVRPCDRRLRYRCIRLRAVGVFAIQFRALIPIFAPTKGAGANMSDAHESPIKTPSQLITVVVLSFVVPIIIILLLAKFVTSSFKPAAGSDSNTPQAIEARIRPVASLEIRDPNAPRVLKTGAEVYKSNCAACHDSGAANAPKLGDAGAWAPRIKAGYDALLAAVLKGKGAMPAQGGGDFTDTEIGRAVVHMTNAGGAKFAEPAAPAAAPAVASPTAAAASTPATVAVATAAAPAAAAAAAAAPAATAPAAHPGKVLYDTSCAACHAAGVANAPKFGDKASWGARLKEPVAALVADVVKGKGAMPPKGGRMDVSEADIKAAVEYMLSAVK